MSDIQILIIGSIDFVNSLFPGFHSGKLLWELADEGLNVAFGWFNALAERLGQNPAPRRGD